MKAICKTVRYVSGITKKRRPVCSFFIRIPVAMLCITLFMHAPSVASSYKTNHVGIPKPTLAMQTGSVFISENALGSNGTSLASESKMAQRLAHSYVVEWPIKGTQLASKQRERGLTTAGRLFSNACLDLLKCAANRESNDKKTVNIPQIVLINSTTAPNRHHRDRQGLSKSLHTSTAISLRLGVSTFIYASLASNQAGNEITTLPFSNALGNDGNFYH